MVGEVRTGVGRAQGAASRGRSDDRPAEATAVLSRCLEPSSALPSWHSEPLTIQWPLLGAPSLTVARLGRPFPPFLGKGRAERRVVGGW